MDTYFYLFLICGTDLQISLALHVFTLQPGMIFQRLQLEIWTAEGDNAVGEPVIFPNTAGYLRSVRSTDGAEATPQRAR